MSEPEARPTHGGQPEAFTPRATQTIPPALRRKVLRRDGHCKVPGCRHATFVDLHHVQPRSEGGQQDADGLIVLGSAHHRSVHSGQLCISGRVSNGLEFRHADGSPYGDVGSPRLAAACELVFRGLRNLGFREQESRLALDRACASSDAGSVNPEGLLRAALGLLTAANR